MFKRRKPGRTSAKDIVPALEIQLLSHQDIEPFSLMVKQGEIFGLVGPGGSGKSTIIDLLSSRKTPIDGAISIMGYDNRRCEHQARKRIPLVLATVGLVRYEHLQVSAFSSAFKRRLALARALLHDPPLLLLDEPTRDIEEHERVAFWEMLFALRAQGKTILLTTRDWEEASTLCDRVAHLSQGKLQAVWERAAQKDAASEKFCSRAAEPN